MAITFVASASTVSFTTELSNIFIIPLNRRFLIFDKKISNNIKGNVVASVNLQYKQTLINIGAIVEKNIETISDIARIIIFFIRKLDGKLANKSWLYVSSLFQFDVNVAIEAIAE